MGGSNLADQFLVTVFHQLIDIKAVVAAGNHEVRRASA